MGISPRVFSFFVAAGGSLPPSGFCPAGNTPLPPLRALKRRARNALAQIPSSREECATFPIADYQMLAPRAISTSCFTFPLADYQTPAPRALFHPVFHVPPCRLSNARTAGAFPPLHLWRGG